MRPAYINKNMSFDRVFARIGKGCRGNPDPENLDIDSLAREFERLAGEMRVVPPENIHAATGHQFTVDMLERVKDLAHQMYGEYQAREGNNEDYLREDLPF